MQCIHVIHENPAWLPPLAEAFDQRGLPWVEWNLSCGTVDLNATPPQGIFYNRMSASSHTRGHRYAAEFTAAVLAWLKRHGRRVVNGSRALDLEISKARQYAALEEAGIAVPRTVVMLGEQDRIMEAARAHFGADPIILKPNRVGKKLGVHLFQDVGALEVYLQALPDEEHPAVAHKKGGSGWRPNGNGSPVKFKAKVALKALRDEMATVYRAEDDSKDRSVLSILGGEGSLSCTMDAQLLASWHKEAAFADLTSSDGCRPHHQAALHEEDRFPFLRALDNLVPVPGAFGGGRIASIH